MRLLLFSDLHCDVAAARHLVQQSHQADVLVGAGDFASVRRNLDQCIDVLQQCDRPVVLVAGNNETTDELQDACSNWPQARILHGSSVAISNITFFGIGGGIPVTPFGSWSYDFTEDQARLLLANCPAGCVLISHSPPKGAVDRSSRGLSLGSVAVRETILQKKPALVVCGHIHESGGMQEKIENTVVINAGPDGIEWEL
jgi:Icc-related predicted phosphoesterase